MRSFAVVALLALAACGGEKEQSAAQAPLPPPPSPATPEASPRVATPPPAGNLPGIRFDPATLTQGMRIGELEAEVLVLSKAVDSSLVGSAGFKGELRLTGRAVPHFDSARLEVCFEPDSAGAAGLPRWAGDTRRSWFCFANQPEAKQSLAALGETRPATIVIDRFTIHKGMSDQVNSARLVRVISRGDPTIRLR